jgi:hypothetical protein
MSTTGRFRNDLIAAAASAVRDPVTGAPVVATANAATPYGNWLDRMQRTRGRHAAITKNLYTWSNYKNWADRVRDTWEEPSASRDASRDSVPRDPKDPRKPR